MNIDFLYEHFVNRSIWELENICIKEKCVICNMYKEIILELFKN